MLTCGGSDGGIVGEGKTRSTLTRQLVKRSTVQYSLCAAVTMPVGQCVLMQACGDPQGVNASQGRGERRGKEAYV
jgi:hypothetical protein